MIDKQTDFRKFRGGAWDLRKIERRKEQLTIAFPDRRKIDRRTVGLVEDFSAAGMLQWVEPSGLDD